MYIAIGNEEGETEQTMIRKLGVLNSIIAMLHGPATQK